MLTCAKEVTELLGTRLEAQMEIARRTTAMSSDFKEFTKDDIKQIVVGFHQVLEEAIQEQGNATFKFFTETVITGIRAQGQSPESIVRTSVVFVTSAVADIVQAAAPEHRDELIPWFGKFAGDYIAAVLVTAIGGPTSKSS
jgi:hypothetical protein